MKSRFLGILSLIILSFALAACNSSSGSSSSAGGAVAAAPLKDANVFGHTAEGTAVLIGKTNANGSIVFNSSLSSVKFPSVVYSEGGTNFKTDAAFTGKLKGIMESSSSQVYLTPANTLVAELYEDGMSLDQAQERVETIIEKEMGLNKVHPLANPLSNLNDSEIVSQALMAVLDISEDDAAPMAAAIAKVAGEIQKNNKSFTDAVRDTTVGSFASGKMSLTDFVGSRQAEIVQAAKDALGDAADETKLNENVAVVTTEFPTSMTATSVTDVTDSMVAKDYTINITTTVFSNKVNTTTGKSESFSNQKVVIASHPAIGKLVAVDDTHFTYTVTEADFENVTLPVNVSFTLMADADNSIQLTQGTTFVAAESLTILEVDFDGKGLYEFQENSVNKKALLGADNFVAWVETVNDFASLNDNIDVRFVAPEGFKFEHTVDGKLTNTDTYDVKDITRTAASEYSAKIPADVVTLVTENAVEAGYQTVGLQVIDEKTNAVLKTGSDELIFVPAGDTKNQLIGMALSESTANTDATSVNLITLHDAVVDSNKLYKPTAYSTTVQLKGKIETWNIAADGTETPSKGTLTTNGKFYVVSDASKAVFNNPTSSEVEHNIEITDTSIIDVTGDTVTVDIEGILEYDTSVAPGNDTLRLMYVPSEGNGQTVISQGGLAIENETTN